MPAIIALVLWLAGGAAAAADIALIGVIGDKAAVLALDGGDPKTVKVGQKWNGITVLSVEKDRATVEFEGRKRVLQYGQHYRSAAPSSERAPGDALRRSRRPLHRRRRRGEHADPDPTPLSYFLPGTSGTKRTGRTRFSS